MYVDAMVDRVEERTKEDFDLAVEASRLGTIFGRSQKAYDSWQRRRKRKTHQLDGANLERAIQSLAFTNPEYVVVGPRV